MKRFLTGIALAVAISMVSVAPVLAVDLMGHTTLGAVNTIDSENYVPSETASVQKPLLWHPLYGSVPTDYERNQKTFETFQGLRGNIAKEMATLTRGLSG